MGRKLGQHFLFRESLLRRIATAACPEPARLVIEIGPGRGALTEFLLERAERVLAVELDRELAGHLRLRFAGRPRLEVVCADVLETDLSQWGRAVVAGNLPYYISSPIIEKTVRLGRHLERAVFLVQKEVADRLTASPGGREYGFLTVQTSYFAQAAMLFRVPASAFRPPPKVESAVVRLTPRPLENEGETDGFLRFAGACFRQKRKTLRNNLAPVYGREAVGALPEASLRAEQLPLEQLLDLYHRLAPSPS